MQACRSPTKIGHGRDRADAAGRRGGRRPSQPVGLALHQRIDPLQQVQRLAPRQRVDGRAEHLGQALDLGLAPAHHMLGLGPLGSGATQVPRFGDLFFSARPLSVSFRRRWLSATSLG
jgi:hypothetical protein